MIGAVDAPVTGAYILAALAAIPAALSYLRGRHSDDRSIAIKELEVAVERLGDENVRLHDENRELTGRVKACEEDRRLLWIRFGQLGGAT